VIVYRLRRTMCQRDTLRTCVFEVETTTGDEGKEIIETSSFAVACLLHGFRRGSASRMIRATKVVTAFASESTYSPWNQETQIEDGSLVLDSWSSQWDDGEQVEDK